MAEEEGEASEDTRMQLLQQYCLKTIKQVLIPFHIHQALANNKYAAFCY